MKRLVEFSLDDGGSILVEVEEPPAGPMMRGIGSDRLALVAKADKTFEAASVAAEANFTVPMTWRRRDGADK